MSPTAINVSMLPADQDGVRRGEAKNTRDKSLERWNNCQGKIGPEQQPDDFT